MNDDDIIQRLRSALDEVADAPASGEAIVDTPHVRESFGATRWIAVAAAVLLIGTASVVLVQRRGSDDPSSSATTSAATNPTTTSGTSPTSTPRTTVLSDPGFSTPSWYTFDLPWLTAGTPEFDHCCKPWPAPGPDLAMAWGELLGIDRGVMVLRAHRTLTGGPATLTYSTFGMTKAQAVALEKQVTEGSGLPYVLADPSMQLIGNGMYGDGSLVSQAWTNGSNTVALSVGDYRGQLELFTTNAGNVTTTTVAGHPALRFDDDMGSSFVWQNPPGTWSTLHIDIGLSKRIDEILGAVQPAHLPDEQAQPTTTTVDAATSTPGVAGELSLARTGLDVRVSTEQTTGSGWFLATKSVDPASATSSAPAALTWSQQSAPTGEAVPSFRVGDHLRWTARDGSVTAFTVTGVVHLPANGGDAVGGPTTALQLRVQEIDANPTLVFARLG